MRLECYYCGTRFTAESLDENCPKCGGPNPHPFRPLPSDDEFFQRAFEAYFPPKPSEPTDTPPRDITRK